MPFFCWYFEAYISIEFSAMFGVRTFTSHGNVCYLAGETFNPSPLLHLLIAPLQGDIEGNVGEDHKSCVHCIRTLCAFQGL